jgi:VWFA-related protein
VAGLLLVGQTPAPNPSPAAASPAAKNAPEMSTVNAAATFSSRVNMVMVPVVVRDSQGRPVGNLKPEDFQLFDKGKPQQIARFSVERPAEPVLPANVGEDEKEIARPPTAGAAAVPERFLAYVFDDVHLNASDLLFVRRAADRHLAELGEPSTRVAIFTISGITRLDFTEDRQEARRKLEELMPRPPVAASPEDCPQVSYYLADKILNRHDDQALQIMIQEALTCMPSSGDQQADLQAATQATNSAVFRMLNLGENDARVTMLTLGDIVRRMSAAPGSRNVILLSPGFYLTSALRWAEGELLDRAIRANVTMNSLDARGLYTVIPGGDASQKGFRTGIGSGMQAMLQTETASAETSVMAELAFGTGGGFFRNHNDLQQGLKQLTRQPEFIYLLGFSPQNLKMDGSYHALRVALKNLKGFDIQARGGYYAPDHTVDPAEAAKQEIQEAFFSRDELQDIPVDLHMQFFKSSDITAKLNVMAKLDVRQLRFRKADERNSNQLTVVAGVFDRNGNYVAAVQQIVDMRLRDQTLATAQSSGITIRTSLDVTPGSYLVRLVVRDAEGQQMAARNGVIEIPY